jgi:hypothetical protein
MRLVFIADHDIFENWCYLCLKQFEGACDIRQSRAHNVAVEIIDNILQIANKHINR